MSISDWENYDLHFDVQDDSCPDCGGDRRGGTDRCPDCDAALYARIERELDEE